MRLPWIGKCKLRRKDAVYADVDPGICQTVEIIQPSSPDEDLMPQYSLTLQYYCTKYPLKQSAAKPLNTSQKRTDQSPDESPHIGGAQKSRPPTQDPKASPCYRDHMVRRHNFLKGKFGCRMFFLHTAYPFCSKRLWFKNALSFCTRTQPTKEVVWRRRP